MAKSWDLRERTMEFTVAVFAFCRTVPTSDEARDIVRQLRRCASSVAANWRAARRSSSDKVFAAKVAVVVEEADEAGFWLELLGRVGLIQPSAARALRGESDELVSIFMASRKTVLARVRARRKAKRVKA